MTQVKATLLTGGNHIETVSFPCSDDEIMRLTEQNEVGHKATVFINNLVGPKGLKSIEGTYDTKGELLFEDARKIVPEELPDIDLICGGFPCQSFSIAGKRGGFEDARGTLFFEIARIARVKRPKYLLLENVPGLLSHDSGRTFATILNALSELGYNVAWQTLNSANFGVPQIPPKAFIFAI